MTQSSGLPPEKTARADQLVAAVDAHIDQLGAAMSRSRGEGVDEYLVLIESMKTIAGDETLTRSDVSLYLARAADRPHRALAELEARR